MKELANEREGSEGETWPVKAGGWMRGTMGGWQGRWVRERSCWANRKRIDRWRDGFDWLNKTFGADGGSQRPPRDEERRSGKAGRGRPSSAAACYSRCHLFHLLLISAWTYLPERKLNIDLFFSLHCNSQLLFFFFYTYTENHCWWNFKCDQSGYDEFWSSHMWHKKTFFLVLLHQRFTVYYSRTAARCRDGPHSSYR